MIQFHLIALKTFICCSKRKLHSSLIREAFSVEGVMHLLEIFHGNEVIGSLSASSEEKKSH